MTSEWIIQYGTDERKREKMTAHLEHTQHNQAGAILRFFYIMCLTYDILEIFTCFISLAQKIKNYVAHSVDL